MENVVNQIDNDETKVQETSLKEWKPLELRLLDIGRNTRSGNGTDTFEIGVYQTPS